MSTIQGVTNCYVFHITCTKVRVSVLTYLLHVTKDVHSTTEEVLSLLAVQLVDELRRVVVVCILISTAFTHSVLETKNLERSVPNVDSYSASS